MEQQSDTTARGVEALPIFEVGSLVCHSAQSQGLEGADSGVVLSKVQGLAPEYRYQANNSQPQSKQLPTNSHT
jgi:hypothetical protein